MKFGENLQKLRKEQGISQEQLAEKLGVTRQSVSKWESGSSYPEMDKIVTLCKIFHCDLDVLINKDITEERQRKDASGVIKGIFLNICDYVKMTILVFEHKSIKEIIKMFAQIAIIICVILCFAIPFVILKEIVISLFYTGDNFFSLFFTRFFGFLFNALYVVLAIASFLYIFKIKFLDSEEIVEVVEDDIHDSKEDKDNVLEEVQNKPKKVRVIRKNNHDFSLLDLFTKAITICIKFFLLFVLIPIVIGLVLAVVGLVVGISIMFQGVFFIGPVLLLLGVVVFSIVLVEMILDFIFNLKFSKRRIIVTIISSFVVSAVGLGLSFWFFLNLTVVNGIPSNFSVKTEEKVYTMTDRLSIEYYNFYDTKFVADDSLGNQVKVKISYYPEINSVHLVNEDDTVFISYDDVNGVSLQKITDSVIRDLKKGKIHNYNSLGSVKMTVSATHDNLVKLNESWNY